MAEDIFQGYKGKALGVLRKFNVRVWGQTVIETIRMMTTGILYLKYLPDIISELILTLSK